MGEVDTMLFLLSLVPDCLDSQLALTVGVGWVLVTPIPAAHTGMCSSPTALENRALGKRIRGKTTQANFYFELFF